jgi:hypothetical protein
LTTVPSSIAIPEASTTQPSTHRPRADDNLMPPAASGSAALTPGLPGA